MKKSTITTTAADAITSSFYFENRHSRNSTNINNSMESNPMEKERGEGENSNTTLLERIPMGSRSDDFCNRPVMVSVERCKFYFEKVQRKPYFIVFHFLSGLFDAMTFIASIDLFSQELFTKLIIPAFPPYHLLAPFPSSGNQMVTLATTEAHGHSPLQNSTTSTI